MGVRGLTTFIKNNEKKYFKDYKLHSCKVLLDGNSIASNLYMWSNVESAFGGDYDKFAKYVKEFFKLVQKCEIRPLVIFDGGYEERKLKTVYQRMRDKFNSARNVQPFSQSRNFPVFMRIVFREVLTELNVPFCQSDFEADDELAAVARQLNCPVISFDSDFYIYDVLYIPFPTVNLHATPFEENAVAKSSPKYYLECKVYNVDSFIQSFGGLDKSMLPILAALLGNDYIRRTVFKAFYSNLKIPKGKTNPLQRRVQAVIDWLRNETFDSAITKILGRMKKHTRKRVARQIKKITNGYIQCSSVLGEYLGITPEEHSIDSSQLIQVDTSILTSIEENDKEPLMEETEEDSLPEADGSPDDEPPVESNSEQSDVESCSDQDTNEVVCEEENTEDQTDIPDWLIVNARRGKIQSCIMDILCLRQYFSPPQVEDFSQSPSHKISLKILGALVGLLIGQSNGYVKYWTRKGSRLEWYTVDPIFKTGNVTFPTLDKLPDLVEHQRLSILLEVAGVSDSLQQFPEEWRLFVVAILFWLKNMTEPAPSESHLHTLIMCLVGMYTIDNNIGVHRNKQTFTKKYKNYLSKLTEARSKEKEVAKELKNKTRNILNETVNVKPNTALGDVARDDCITIFASILPYHHLSEQLKVKPKLFCTTTIHALAQFQSCLFHLMVLNSVLNFPLKETKIYQIFSGTFAYNMFANLSKRNNIIAYIETFFQQSPTLLNLYKSLVQSFYSILGENCLKRKPAKVNRKKKKDMRSEEKEIDEIINEKCMEEEEFFDENNMFSQLSLEA